MGKDDSPLANNELRKKRKRGCHGSERKIFWAVNLETKKRGTPSRNYTPSFPTHSPTSLCLYLERALLFGHSLFGYWGTHTSEGLGLCMAPHKIFFHATHPQSPTLPLSAIGRHHTTTLPINNALPHQSSTFCIGKLAIFNCF